VPRLFSNLLLLTAHLLLAGLLIGAFLCLLLPRTGAQQFYLARAGAGLAGLLLVWVGVLLVQWLQQRRWIGAGALALLLAADGLALCGGVLLMVTTGAIPGPN
jgi:TM2 domain-containing membrane protein YozV